MSDDYARAAARVAAAQLAEAAGFEAAQRSSLDVLADLLLRYTQELGAGSHAYAELAGRGESNELDVVRAAPPMAAMACLRGGRGLAAFQACCTVTGPATFPWCRPSP